MMSISEACHFSQVWEHHSGIRSKILLFGYNTFGQSQDTYDFTKSCERKRMSYFKKTRAPYHSLSDNWIVWYMEHWFYGPICEL